MTNNCEHCNKKFSHDIEYGELYCYDCKKLIIRNLNLQDRVCVECRYKDRIPDNDLCVICVNSCEYCKIGIPRQELKGCGKRICNKCDELRPYHNCVVCKKKHRDAHKACKDCHENKKPEPPKDITEKADYDKIWGEECYGACNVNIQGYENICHHCISVVHICTKYAK